MSNHETIFQDFTDALWSANDEAALRCVAERAASALGFERFAYLGIHEDQTIWISNYPREWISRYFEQSYERIDPIVTNARKQRRAFSWHGDAQASSRVPEQRRFFGEARDFGIGSGLTIPIRSGFGQLTALTLATDGKSTDVEKVLSAGADVIELIGLYYHARVDVSLNAVPVQQFVNLSRRECQCLSWAARGKTTSEIGAIIGLSARTVSFHFENARRKLNAANITQAVAIAVRQGLVR